ncbi:hypothetical protein DPMN_160391 [Dreissena polymorpha]|uniref:Uncharacterized protein n=2 Tax=Dreissena polymorpha TaxID=45954 RepID=A0A9D4EMR5_DREPO|nr:hypothetical protein DPMN_160391 [Dreissena polymorpha]
MCLNIFGTLSDQEFLYVEAVCSYSTCGSSGLMVGRWRRDREVPGSNPALTAVISLSKKFVPHLLLSTQVYKWVPVREISQCAVAAWCAIC